VSKSHATIYDVIDNFWGRDPLRKIMRADKIAFKSFGKEVNRFYESYVPPQPGDTELRTYYGGLVATNFSLSGKQTTLFNNLLYSHSTVIPDPIARWYFDDYEHLSRTPPAEYFGGQAAADQSEWIGWLLQSYRAFQWSLEVSREVIHFFVSGLMQVRPLVEAGIIVLLSQAHSIVPRSKEIIDQVLADASSDEFRSALVEVDEQLPLWDNCRGGIMTPQIQGQTPDPGTVQWAKAKEAAYYIRKSLAIAASAGAHYIPENATDYALLAKLITSSGHRAGLSDWRFELARNMKELHIPSLEGLPLVELIAIRKNSSAFEEFRTWLARRLVAREPSLQKALLDLTSEEISAEISRLQDQLRNSSVMKTYVKEEGVKVVVGALVGIASTLSLGAPVFGAVAGALAGVGASLVKRDRLTDSSVIALLARMNRVASDATFGESGKLPGLPLALAQPFFGEFRVSLVSFASGQPSAMSRTLQSGFAQ
jgi:hypothetical protein